ncbi:reverse transcriptase domain-containing protein [Tanacetum coccineum]
MCQGHVSPSGGRRRASIFNGISIQMFLPTSKRIQPDNNGGRGRRKDWVSYERRSILFHPHAERIKELYSYTLEDDGKGLNRSKGTERRNILIDLTMSSFGVKEGRFLGYIVTEEGLRADPGRIQEFILSPTPRSSNQIRSLLLQLTAISKFILKLEELKHPLHEARSRMETAKGPGWTKEDEEAFRRIKRKLGKLPTLAIPKEGEDLMLCLRQRNETISFVLLVEWEGTQIPVSYVSRPLQGMEICYTLTEKRVQALIHIARSLRTIFRKHKVKVVTDGPIEETLKLSGREGRLGK